MGVETFLRSELENKLSEIEYRQVSFQAELLIVRHTVSIILMSGDCDGHCKF